MRRAVEDQHERARLRDVPRLSPIIAHHHKSVAVGSTDPSQRKAISSNNGSSAAQYHAMGVAGVSNR